MKKLLMALAIVSLAFSGLHGVPAVNHQNKLVKKHPAKKNLMKKHSEKHSTQKHHKDSSKQHAEMHAKIAAEQKDFEADMKVLLAKVADKSTQEVVQRIFDHLMVMAEIHKEHHEGRMKHHAKQEKLIKKEEVKKLVSAPVQEVAVENAAVKAE